MKITSYEEIDSKYYLIVQKGEITQKAIIMRWNRNGFIATMLQNNFNAILETYGLYQDSYVYFENEENAKAAVEWLPTAQLTKKIMGV